MAEEKKDSGNTELIVGTSLSAYAAASTIVTGAVCPLCVIASPLLLGVGLIKKIKNQIDNTEDTEK
ncbi:MAG: hypothetical protein GF334_10445 [Candidatus Altiarchaeales archaeon]|nr:hypothetical protein [Candidatus Altiarchaeales archaeon]